MAGTLVGQAALVTGGGRGIGRAIAEELAAEGAAVTVVSRTATQIEAVSAAIQKAGGRAQAVTCDVTDRASVERAVKAAESKFGPISFLVNGAGQAGPFGPIGFADPDEWWAAQAVHVRGPMLFMSAVLPGMRARKAGRILNICSIGGILTSPNISAYGVGKCAEIRLTEYVDAEGKEDGVRAFAVQPGTIITDMAHETLNSPVAQRYLPWMIDLLSKISKENSDKELQRCATISAQIAAGKHDALAGRYVDFAHDLAALAQEIDRNESATAKLENNKRTVLAFYDAAINRKDFAAASKYMGETYTQHNPTAVDGRAGLESWLKEFGRVYPDLRAEVKRIVAEGDYVVLHVYGVNGPAPHGAAVIDIFRLQNGKVVEHWDVIQPIPAETLNDNTMF